jgi:hypothetical protein
MSAYLRVYENAPAGIEARVQLKENNLGSYDGWLEKKDGYLSVFKIESFDSLPIRDVDLHSHWHVLSPATTMRPASARR